MAKSDVQPPPSQRPGESAGVQAVANPGFIEGPLATAARGEDRALAAAPAEKSASNRGRYRRVFACATGLSDSPNEERPS
jgi:hypothetical protein